ncbi:MAG: phospholipid-binding protein MlaC [Alphaproteobacteria bacterium]
MTRLAGWVAAALLAVGLLGSGSALAATVPDAAKAFIETISNRAITILSDKTRPLEAREEDVRLILSSALAIEALGRFTLGRHWAQASEEQRADYQTLFADWVVRSYARRLSAYSGESLTVLRAAPMGKEDALVMTQLTQTQGAPLSAGWRVRDTGPGGMKILDVIVEGVSMVVAQRDEFDAIAQKNGVSGLIELLRLRVSQYTAKAS